MDIWLLGWGIRIFWRGFIWPPLYSFHDWGFYGFGAFVGFMVWPPDQYVELNIEPWAKRLGN